MKRLLFTLISLCLVNSACLSQSTAFNKGNKLLDVGIGINSFYDEGMPIGASFEVGISDQISIGGSFDYLSTKYKSYDFYNDVEAWAKFRALYIGIRGSYHFSELLNINNNKIDLYAGPALGYRSIKWNDPSTVLAELSGKYGSGLFLGGYIGGKYYFNKKIGVFLEAGEIGSTNARVGLAFKF